MSTNLRTVTCGSCGRSSEVPTGRSLRQQREVASVTLRELSKQVGLSRAWLSQVENDLGVPSPEIVAAYKRLRKAA